MPSGIKIGNKLALDPGDSILELELTHLQSFQLKLVYIRIGLQGINGRIQITMFQPQCLQPLM